MGEPHGKKERKERKDEMRKGWKEELMRRKEEK